MRLYRALTKPKNKAVIAQYSRRFGYTATHAFGCFGFAGADAFAVALRLDKAAKPRGEYVEYSLTDGTMETCVALAGSFGVPSLLKVAFHKRHVWDYRRQLIKSAADIGFDAILNIPHRKNRAMTSASALYAESLGLEVVWEFQNYDQMVPYLPEMGRKALVLINQRDLKTGKVDEHGICEFMECAPWRDIDSPVFIGGSGLKNADDAKEAFDHGCDAIIMSTALMDTPAYKAPKLIAEIKGTEPVSLCVPCGYQPHDTHTHNGLAGYN